MENDPGPAPATSLVENDRPTTADKLGYRDYCEDFASLLLNKGTSTPLTIGIFGRWGTGKTSFLKMLERRLQGHGIDDETDADPDEEAKPPKNDFRRSLEHPATVWFYSWRYEKEDNLWAALLQSILNQMTTRLPALVRWRFKFRLLLNRIAWDRVPGQAVKYGWRLLVAAVPVAVSLVAAHLVNGDVLKLKQTTDSNLLNSLILWVGAGSSLGLFMTQFGKPLVEAVKKKVHVDVTDFLKKDQDYQQHIAFLDQFLEQFRAIVKRLPVTSNIKLVVFIDDLDRCKEQNVLQVLDAIKLFLDVPGCAFVLGLDQDVVYQAMKTTYPDDKTRLEYLEKIIQLPFNLPPLKEGVVQSYVENLLHKHLEVNGETCDSRCDRVFMTCLEANPRKLKRAINTFVLLWNLAQRRKEAGAKQVNQVLLAKVVVLQHRFPELSTRIRKSPELIKDLERYFDYAKNCARNALTGPDVQAPFSTLAMQLREVKRYNWDDIVKNLGLPPGSEAERRAATPSEDEVRHFIQQVDEADLYEGCRRVLKEFSDQAEAEGKPGWDSIFAAIKEHKEIRRTELQKNLVQLNDFLHQEELSSLLVLYYQAPAEKPEPSCCFAPLNREEIEHYFILTEPAQLSPAATSPGAQTIETP